jgi:hypothetical protein
MLLPQAAAVEAAAVEVTLSIVQAAAEAEAEQLFKAGFLQHLHL